MAIKKRGKYYSIYFRDENGKLTWRATGTTIEAEARKLDRANAIRVRTLKQRRIMRKLSDPDAPEIPRTIPAEPQHKRGTVKLDTLFDIASKYRALSRFHRNAMLDFIRETGLKYADQVTPKIGRDYLEKRFGQGNGKSYNNYRTYLNTIFRLTLIESGLPASPFASLVPRRVTNVESHRPITDAEFRRLYSGAEEPYRTALIIGYHTGLRLMDCFRLSPDCIENGWIVRIPGKTIRFRRAVQIPVHPELEKHLSALPAAGEEPFCANAPSQARINTVFAELFSEFGVNDTTEGKASFHSLRSSFITRMREKGMPEHSVRSMAGHVKSKTTDVYSHDRTTPLRMLDYPGVLTENPT